MAGKYPAGSFIEQFLPANYSDVLSYKLQTKQQLSADDIQVAFWTIKPRWVNFLFKVRNALVKPFGLDEGRAESSELLEAAIRSGGSYGITSVPAKSACETVIRLDDSHLSAYLSIHVAQLDDEATVSATTLVHFHKKIGYIYFYAIFPFHYFVVKQMLKTAVNTTLKKQ